MKTTLLATAALCAAMANAQDANGWSMSGSPDDGMQDITFPFKFNTVPHKPMYYFAQQFSFKGKDASGYTGLQPQDDKDGNTMIRGVFSTFTANSTTDHANCSPGADGGPGVSCGVVVPGNYDSIFNMVVENIGGTTWRGLMVEVSSGTVTEVGTWTLVDGTLGIQPSQGGFIEYFIGSPTCQEMEYVDVVVYNPTSSTPGAGDGDTGKPWAQGGCDGKGIDAGDINFSTTQVSDNGGGWRATFGF